MSLTRKSFAAGLAALLLMATHMGYSQAWTGRPSTHMRSIDRTSVSAETSLQVGGDQIGRIAVADFNGDGYGDVALVLDNSLRVYRGNGTTFAPFGAVYPGTVMDLTAGDFNGDGHQDLLIVGSESDEGTLGLFLLPGLGDGRFGAPLPITGANLPGIDSSCRVASGVFTQRHKEPVDFALSCDTAPSSLYFGINNGKGNYALSTPFQAVSSGRAIQSISAGDVNGDGLSEVLVASSAMHGAANRSVDLLWNSAAGFHLQRNIVSSQGVVILADYDGDGLADLLAVEDGRLILKRSDGSSLSPAKTLSRKSACNVIDVDAGSLQGIQGSLALDIALSEMCPNTKTGVLSPSLAALLNTAGTKVTVSRQNDSSDSDSETIGIKVQPLVGTGTPTGKVLVAVPNLPTQSLSLSGGSASVVASKESASKVTALFTASEVFGGSFGKVIPLGIGAITLSGPGSYVWRTNGTFSVSDPCETSTGPVTLRLSDTATNATICSISLTSTTGSCSGGSSLAVGGHTLSFSTTSGVLGSCSTGATPTFTVLKASPSVSVSSPAVTYPGRSTLTATMSSGVNSTGTINFEVNGGSIGTVSLSGGSAQILAPVENSGSYTVTAVYSGDGNNNGTSNTATLNLAKSSPGATLTANHTSVTYGNLTVFTTTVSGGASPTGSVSFEINGAVFGTIGLSGNSATYSGNNETWQVGTYTISGVYSGDANNNGATGTIGGFTVTKQTPAATISSSSASVASGSSVTLTANVANTAPLGSPPSGAVTFFDNGTAIGIAALSSGVGSFATAGLSSGSHSFSYSYGGDGNYNATSSAATTVQSGAAPVLVDAFATPNSVTVGSPVTLRGVIDTGDSRTATGTVTFTNGGTSLGTGALSTVTTTNLFPQSTDVISGWNLDGSCGIASPTVTANTAAAPDGTMTADTYSYPNTNVGSGCFSGNSFGLNGGASYDGQPLTFSVWVKPSISTTLYIYLTNFPATAAVGQTNCAVTAGQYTRCAVSGVGVNTGVALFIRAVSEAPFSAVLWGVQVEVAAQPGPYIPTSGAAATGTGAVATLTTSALPVGTDSVTVSYSGDTVNQATTGGPAIVEVAKASLTLAIASSLNPAVSGQMVTFTATLTDGVSPTGSVTFLDGATPLGTATVSGGVARLATNSLSVGTHSITAAYAGDASNNSVTSSALSEVVNKGAPTLSISSSKNPAIYGDSILFTASLPANVTGTITFLDGATTIGSATLSGGSATFTTPGLSVGTHSITAAYAGDSNYNAATSSVLSQVVNKAALTMSVTSSLNPSKYNQSIILTLTAHGGGAVPTGTVSVMDGGNSLGALTLTPDGQAAITTSTLAAGIHTFTFTYNGDGNYY